MLGLAGAWLDGEAGRKTGAAIAAGRVELTLTEAVSALKVRAG
jgi:hypothetical protein